MLKKLTVAALALVIIGLLGISLPHAPQAVPPAALPLSSLLGDSGQEFPPIQPQWRYEFPQDHGAHPDFQVETWHFTGTLTAGNGRRFGFQLSLVRLALSPAPPPIESAWAAHQIYFAQLAVADEQAGRFYTFERASRAALGLAGAEGAPARIWVEDWRLQVADGAGHEFQIQAADGDLRLELALAGVKPVITELDPLSGDPPGGAYHSYWIARLRVQGTLTLSGAALPVTGSAWLDRTWGTAPPLGRGQLAFHRFTLQLDDGRELLLTEIKRRDGSAPPIASGWLIAGDGSLHRLDRNALKLETLEQWRSPRDSVRYPARWRLYLPAQNLTLDIRPLLAGQELDLPVRYWGGSVKIQGQSVSGSGQVELTGYAPGGPML